MKLYIGIVLILVLASCFALPQSGNPDQQQCTKGDNKKIACNLCVCVRSGEWGCTKMACDAEDTGCVTGDVFTQEGVSCACFDGQYICGDY